LNADPLVMEFYPSTLTSAESDAFVDRIEAHFDKTGFGLWAVELVSSREFAGYVGLWPDCLFYWLICPTTWPGRKVAMSRCSSIMACRYATQSVCSSPATWR
jgi:RimJ/RimL family protein N-acetyltransferase